MSVNISQECCYSEYTDINRPAWLENRRDVGIFVGTGKTEYLGPFWTRVFLLLRV